MKSRILLLAVLLGLAGQLQSCITSSTASGIDGVPGEVVERSREKAPSWAGLRPFVMHDQNLNYGYIHIESQHQDLPLGIKTTQQNALTQGKNTFKDTLTTSIVKAAESVDVDFSRLGSAMSTQIESACDLGWTPNAKIADIFFEKFRPTVPTTKSGAEFYNIYVMVEVPKIAMTESLRGVAKRLKNSGNTDLRKIGQFLDNRVSLVH